MADIPDPQLAAPNSPRRPEPDTVDLPPNANLAAGPEPVSRPISPATPPSPPLGEKARPFGDYELLSEIQRGGMGVVYRARERHSGRLVALKMMLDESAQGPADLRRFILEAQATGELHHPGIVAIHAWGEHQGHPFYTMDFVSGTPLNRLLETGPLSFDRAVRYLVGIARAVAAAHALGIVHRDLKPSNVIIDSSDQPRILDFGLAKRQRARPLDAVPAPRQDDKPLPLVGEDILDVLPVEEAAGSGGATTAKRQAPLTEKGAILGTPSYMAPEQVRAEHNRVGPPADVHALGALFYEMLTGRPPFQAAATYETLMQVVGQKPAPLRTYRTRVPATLEAFCSRCLQKEPKARYPEAGSLADDLEKRWHHTTQGRRFTWLTLGALAGVVVLQAILGFEPKLFHQLYEYVSGAGGHLGATTLMLLKLVKTVVLVAAPVLTGLGFLTWLGAWAWHAERGLPLCVAWTLAAAAGQAVWICAGMPLTWGEGPFFVPWFLMAGAWVTLAVPVYRYWTKPPASETEAGTRPAEPYLQKLFAARPATARATGSKSSTRLRLSDPEGVGIPIGLADFELSKTLQNGSDCVLNWGRQKSLDRPVLVWREAQPPRDGAAIPGVVVRHPFVLGLHAVGASPEGHFVVTEPLAATPLAELVQQRPLAPFEAITLAGRLAEALQAFHDQGVCHGRLQAEWVLVHGDLEPALCPCGIPSQASADRTGDVHALGQMLGEWLPPRPRRWRRHFLASVYRVRDAAVTGAYERPADLATDLDRASRAAQLLWRERWTHRVILGLFVLFGLALGPAAVLGDVRANAATRASRLLVSLCLVALLLGFAHARGFVHRWRLRLRERRADHLRCGRGWINLLQLGLLLMAAGGLACSNLLDKPGEDAMFGQFLWMSADLAGFWLAGACLAGLVTFGELLVRTLRRT